MDMNPKNDTQAKFDFGRLIRLTQVIKCDPKNPNTPE